MAKALNLDHLQIAMPPGKEAAARNFYGKLLGLGEVQKPSALAARGGVWFACGPQQVHLGVEAEFLPAKKAHPAFAVDNLDELAALLVAEGYGFSLDPLEVNGRRRGFTNDPFGNRVELIQSEQNDRNAVL